MVEAVYTVDNELRGRWNRLNDGLDEGVRDKWWQRIADAYTESHRHYHTLDHLHRVFILYDQYQSDLKDRKSCAYAIFFHDIVYDPKAKDNETQSAAIFKEFGNEAKIERANETADFIENTTTHCTEAHMNAGQYGSDDIHYFLDFDMAILGVDRSDYEKYHKAIRQEYSHLDDVTYKQERAKVLRLFLQIPNIFATEKFRNEFERQARENIQKEIEQLGS